MFTNFRVEQLTNSSHKPLSGLPISVLKAMAFSQEVPSQNVWEKKLWQDLPSPSKRLRVKSKLPAGLKTATTAKIKLAFSIAKYYAKLLFLPLSASSRIPPRVSVFRLSYVPSFPYVRICAPYQKEECKIFLSFFFFGWGGGGYVRFYFYLAW